MRRRNEGPAPHFARQQFYGRACRLGRAVCFASRLSPLISETHREASGWPTGFAIAILEIFACYRADRMCYIFRQAAKGVAEATTGNWRQGCHRLAFTDILSISLTSATFIAQGACVFFDVCRPSLSQQFCVGRRIPDCSSHTSTKMTSSELLRGEATRCNMGTRRLANIHE